jgi:ABC-type bacteriocin/lantibiotic exporter with double-glycine peptidase domain
MSVDQPGEPRGDARSDAAAIRTVVTGGLIIGLLGVGWFALSHFVMDTAVPDAIGESLGVAFALLVVVSIIGAVSSGGGRHG